MKNGAWEHEKEPETRDQEPGKVKSHRNQELRKVKSHVNSRE